MIRYVLYDEYGKEQGQALQEAEHLGTLVIQQDGKFYRPIHYDLSSIPHTAKCIPVAILNCDEPGVGSEAVPEE